MDKFWCVWRIESNNLSGNYSPTKMYSDIQTALNEARRLCETTKASFVVCEAIVLCEPEKIIAKFTELTIKEKETY